MEWLLGGFWLFGTSQVNAGWGFDLNQERRTAHGTGTNGLEAGQGTGTL